MGSRYFPEAGAFLPIVQTGSQTLCSHNSKSQSVFRARTKSTVTTPTILTPAGHSCDKTGLSVLQRITIGRLGNPGAILREALGSSSRQALGQAYQ